MKSYTVTVTIPGETLWWTRVEASTFENNINGYIYGVAYGNGKFVAVGVSDSHGSIAYSNE